LPPSKTRLDDIQENLTNKGLSSHLKLLKQQTLHKLAKISKYSTSSYPKFQNF
ncbi:483_t:CDS:1, partial [Scutellospora calospora]